MLPLTLITSIFGMNVLFPGEGTRGGVLGDRRRRSSPLLVGMVGFFRYKRWL